MTTFGNLMKNWRKERGLSQLDLSLDANISSRHISFLETGRAKPSREMVLQLSDALDIPLSERNLMLTVSGYSEAFSRNNIEQPEMESVKQALNIMINNHDPYPAMVMDWDWNLVMANQTHQKMMQFFIQQQPNFPESQNLLELLFDPDGFRPFVENWDEVASLLIQRIQKERMMHQDRRSNMLEKLMSYPDIPTQWQNHQIHMRPDPMVNLILTCGDVRLKLFSTLASFGTAIDITMQELIIEQYFPSDEFTKEFLKQLQN